MSQPENLKTTTRPAPDAPADTLAHDLLSGAREISVYLGWPLTKTQRGLAQGDIPAERRGRIYISSKRRLAKHYTGE